jgi:hypothetical protein
MSGMPEPHAVQRVADAAGWEHRTDGAYQWPKDGVEDLELLEALE